MTLPIDDAMAVMDESQHIANLQKDIQALLVESFPVAACHLPCEFSPCYFPRAFDIVGIERFLDIIFHIIFSSQDGF